MTAVERALNSIGKRCFTEYFNEFKNCTDKEKLAQKLLDLNPKASSFAAQITRINNAQRIFESDAAAEALTVIIKSSRVDDETRKRARELLKSVQAN